MGALETVSHVFTLLPPLYTSTLHTSTLYTFTSPLNTSLARSTTRTPNSPGSVLALKEPALDAANLLAGRLGALGELGVEVDDLGSPGRSGAGRLCTVSFARWRENEGTDDGAGGGDLGGDETGEGAAGGGGEHAGRGRGRGSSRWEGECARITMAEGEDEAQVAYSRKSPRVAPHVGVWRNGPPKAA